MLGQVCSTRTDRFLTTKVEFGIIKLLETCYSVYETTMVSLMVTKGLKQTNNINQFDNARSKMT